MTENTPNRRRFNINTNIHCPDDEAFAQIVTKTQVFINEIVALVGANEGNLFVSIDAQNQDDTPQQ